tara:strand:+ start:1006 stop:1761 length:756 start_codon:yes stop_codon:yes gene_type:complete
LIRSKKLSKFKEIKHGFFTKNGGVSKGIYKSLNCGIGSNDKKINVKKNLKIVKLKLKLKKIFLVKQFHSSKFIYLNNKTSISNRSENADAIISEKKGLAIGVLTADCVPILIYDYKRKMIAAIHAGWRGAYKGIVHKVIKFMLNKGCNTKNMTASIGPCISSNHYEVKEPFQKRLIRKNKDNRKFFINKKNKLYFDLSNFVKKQVQLNKIKNVDMLNIDTFNKKNNFFSARRSLKLNQNDYGRNISLIMIN